MNCEHVSSCSGYLWVCGSRYIMRLLLLLGACVGVGLSYDIDECEYGTTYKISLHHNTQAIEFSPGYSSRVVILWKRSNPQASKDDRRKVIGSYYVISNVTQKDNGRYLQRGEARSSLGWNRLNVVAHIESYFRDDGEPLKFFVNMEPSSCNIYFFPGGSSSIDIVRNGWLEDSDSGCYGFKLLKPCGLLNEGLQASCRGRYEIRDSDDNMAMVVDLDMELPAYHSSYLGIGAGVLISALCTCCLKCCCSKKSSSNKESSEAAANEDNENEPAVRYNEFVQEPFGQRQNQLHEPSGTQYPSPPSYTPAAAPLIHNPPTDIMPPAYSETVVLSGPADAPTVPLNADLEPRFEVKGMNFNSDAPLSSDSTHCGVYTSDKLNFL